MIFRFHLFKPRYSSLVTTLVCVVLCGRLGQRSLAGVVRMYPREEQLGQCVTWEDLQSALLSENPQQVR